MAVSLSWWYLKGHDCQDVLDGVGYENAWKYPIHVHLIL